MEAGLAQLVQANAGVAAVCPVGGFLTQLPKDQTLPSWSFIVVSDSALYTFEGESALGSRRLQIDCFGNTGQETIQLAGAVDAVLSGYQGTLPDVDATALAGCFRSGMHDFFDDYRRCYRRMLEYTIWFYQ